MRDSSAPAVLQGGGTLGPRHEQGFRDLQGAGCGDRCGTTGWLTGDGTDISVQQETSSETCSKPVMSAEPWQHKWLMMSAAKNHGRLVSVSWELRRVWEQRPQPSLLFILGRCVPLQRLSCVTAVPVSCLVSPTPANVCEGQEE